MSDPLSKEYIAFHIYLNGLGDMMNNMEKVPISDQNDFIISYIASCFGMAQVWIDEADKYSEF